jgi:hypothetical protein
VQVDRQYAVSRFTRFEIKISPDDRKLVLGPVMETGFVP